MQEAKQSIVAQCEAFLNLRNLVPQHECDVLLRLLRLHSSDLVTFLDNHNSVEKICKKYRSIVGISSTDAHHHAVITKL